MSNDRFKIRKCPICCDNSISQLEFNSQTYLLECRLCSKYYLTDSLYVTLNNNVCTSNALLAAWIRAQNEDKKTPPKLTTYSYKEITSNLPSYSIGEKQKILLRVIEARSTCAGARVIFDFGLDYPLAWAINEGEFRFLIEALVDRKLIDVPTSGATGARREFNKGLKITPDGWDYLEKLSTEPIFSKQAFVAMSFSPYLFCIYKNAIYPAIKRAGYNPHRVDQVSHLDRIDSKIISDINDSKFVIADVTEQKQGVYYEAGYAQGIGKPVIWTCYKGELKNIHFDTRQFNHIFWESLDELEEELFYSIKANIK